MKIVKVRQKAIRSWEVDYSNIRPYYELTSTYLGINSTIVRLKWRPLGDYLDMVRRKVLFGKKDGGFIMNKFLDKFDDETILEITLEGEVRPVEDQDKYKKKFQEGLKYYLDKYRNLISKLLEN